MQKWEYLRLMIRFKTSWWGGIESVVLYGNSEIGKENYKDWNALQDYFNNLGLQGWEMVDTNTGDYFERVYFKRSIE